MPLVTLCPAKPGHFGTINTVSKYQVALSLTQYSNSPIHFQDNYVIREPCKRKVGAGKLKRCCGTVSRNHKSRFILVGDAKTPPLAESSHTFLPFCLLHHLLGMLEVILITFLCREIFFLTQYSYRACRRCRIKVSLFLKNVIMIVNR